MVGYLRENLGPTLVTLHQCHHPEIAVDGDRATGTWYLADRVLSEEWRFVLEGAAFYEATSSLDDLPGFRPSGSSWAPPTGPPDDSAEPSAPRSLRCHCPG